MNKYILLVVVTTLSINALTITHPTSYGLSLLALNDPQILGGEQWNKGIWNEGIYGQAGTQYQREQSGLNKTISSDGMRTTVQPHDPSTIYDPAAPENRQGEMGISSGGWNSPSYIPVRTIPVPTR